MVETRRHPESGLQHPFDPANNFLSRFPVDFKGCFNCGQTDHWQIKSCPAANNGKFNKTMFFNEMWAHKPHTKRAPRQFDNNISRSGSNYFHSNQQSNHNGNNTFGQSSNNYQFQSGNNILTQGGNSNIQSLTMVIVIMNAELILKQKKDDGSQRERILVLCGSVLATTLLTV